LRETPYIKPNKGILYAKGGYRTAHYIETVTIA